MSASDNNSDIFANLKVVKRLSKGKFQVYLTKHEDSMYALKVFPYKEGDVSKYYLNEARFHKLNHNNVINIANTHSQTTTMSNGKPEDASVILMEYAPYGTLTDLILNNKRLFSNEKLIRTYFHQFIRGLEYLHSVGVYHLDLKPENILIGENYQLKIADFDLSFVNRQDKKIVSKGTKYYRAPELAACECKDPAAADMYSVGVLLFALKSAGSLPHIEDQVYNGVNYYKLLQNKDKTEYWTSQCAYLKKSPEFFTKEFKTLIEGALDVDPTMRPTMQELKESKWFNGPIYSDEELVQVMSKELGY